MESIVQFITVLVIFIFVLVITYFTTVWIGNYQKTRNKGVNIELLDAQRLNQSQYVQIVRIGEKFLALGVSKDNITLLCELSEDELITNAEGAEAGGSAFGGANGFGNLLDEARKKLTGKKD